MILEILRKSLKKIIINIGSINISIEDIGVCVINFGVNYKKIPSKHDINRDSTILSNKNRIPCLENLYSGKIIVE